MRYVPRTIEPILKKASKQFPAIILTGPRQAGKTTLLRHLFKKSHRYLSLEPPDVRATAIADPRGFIELHAPPIIFDEIQYAPDLLFYIKEKIDQQRDRFGQYILTGSQNILLMQQVSETLAGRAAILKLLPFSYTEIIGEPLEPFAWEKKKALERKLPLRSFWEGVVRGCYPELIEHPEKDPALWHASYIQTYLERDIRNLRQIGDLTQFQLFLRAVATRSAQIFHLTDVARDIGVTVNTVKAWLAVLEATYQIFILRPYFINPNKRMVKAPKIYFTDPGTLCNLLGIKSPEQLLNGPFSGPVLESVVISEIFKRISHFGEQPMLYFWRTASGNEVDLVVQRGSELIPIEIKASSTPKPKMANGILSFDQTLSKKRGHAYLIYLGDLELPLGSGITALPFIHL